MFDLELDLHEQLKDFCVFQRYLLSHNKLVFFFIVRCCVEFHVRFSEKRILKDSCGVKLILIRRNLQ